MASPSTGIQQLLAAEKKSAEKVAEARKRKARRLKQAKEEAQQEIEAYRLECERQYKEHEARILGSRGDMEAKIEQTTRLKIDELNRNVQANKEKAMQKLLKLVCDIKPELHQNYNVAKQICIMQPKYAIQGLQVHCISDACEMKNFRIPGSKGI